MIGIIDYGMGNLHSVQNACSHLNMESLISSDPAVLAGCDKLILPGVGAFGDMARALHAHGLFEFLQNWNRPLLGICLGMQALFERSYEFGEHEGLGLLKGSVIKMDCHDIRVPQIGWNELIVSSASPLDALLGERPFVYFDHSYVAAGWDPACLDAYCQYGPYVVPAVVRKNNVVGCQFHPEKSGKDGLRILEWFGKEFYENTACH